jgi:hypothetical protein
MGQTLSPTAPHGAHPLSSRSSILRGLHLPMSLLTCSTRNCDGRIVIT